MGTSKELNTRQWRLHDFFKDHEKASVKDVCDSLPEYYSVKLTDGNYSNCPTLYKDINVLNESYQTDHVIVVRNNCFYRGTKEERTSYEETLRRRLVRAAKKYWAVHKKNDSLGQGVFINKANNPIDEVHFIEAVTRISEENDD